MRMCSCRLSHDPVKGFTSCSFGAIGGRNRDEGVFGLPDSGRHSRPRGQMSWRKGPHHSACSLSVPSPCVVCTHLSCAKVWSQVKEFQANMSRTGRRSGERADCKMSGNSASPSVPCRCPEMDQGGRFAPQQVADPTVSSSLPLTPPQGCLISVSRTPCISTLEVQCRLPPSSLLLGEADPGKSILSGIKGTCQWSPGLAGVLYLQSRSLCLASFVLLLLFSRSAVSDSLCPHGLQHARLPNPSSSPRLVLELRLTLLLSFTHPELPRVRRVGQRTVLGLKRLFARSGQFYCVFPEYSVAISVTEPWPWRTQGFFPPPCLHCMPWLSSLKA